MFNILFKVVLGFLEDDLVKYFVYFRFHISDILLLNVFNKTLHFPHDGGLFRNSGLTSFYGQFLVYVQHGIILFVLFVDHTWLFFLFL